MSRLELEIAWRYLRTRGGSRLFSLISLIAIGGVLVGVSALIVINGVMTGMQDGLRDKILVGSPDLRVLPFGQDLEIAKWRPTLATVRKQPGVVAAAPFVLTQGLARTGHAYTEGVFVMGVVPDPVSGAAVTDVRRHIVSGNFHFVAPDSGETGVVVGKRLADRLGVYPGDELTMISPTSKYNAAVGSVIPRLFRYEVAGTFETGMYEYDNSYVYLPLSAAQQFAGLGDAVTGLEARTRTRGDAARVAPALAKSLGFAYRVQDWQDQNASLFQALKLEKLAMAVILLLIVIVAAFNIVSTLTMVVKDKTREIGILKAMGLPSRAVRRIFLAQGVVIGVVGTGLGLVLGLGTGLVIDRYKLISLDPQVYFIDHLPVTMQPRDVIWIVCASIAIAVAATLYPSRQAARLYPVEAIRHE